MPTRSPAYADSGAAPDDAITPEYALLGFLALTPAHGYELHRHLTHELGQLWHASLAHVYNVLKRMEAQGLIRGQAGRVGKHPPQRRFTLTASGRAKLNAWLRKPASSSVRSVRLELLARLYFVRQLEPQRALALLNEQRERLAESVAQLEHIAADAAHAPDFARVAVELRLAQARALQDWLEQRVAPLIVRPANGKRRVARRHGK